MGPLGFGASQNPSMEDTVGSYLFGVAATFLVGEAPTTTKRAESTWQTPLVEIAKAFFGLFILFLTEV